VSVLSAVAALQGLPGSGVADDVERRLPELPEHARELWQRIRRRG
jgi:hypothetical protein